MFFNYGVNTLCFVLFLIMLLCVGLFFLYRRVLRNPETHKSKLLKIIPVVFNLGVSATGALYILIINRIGDSIDGEGLLTLLFAPYTYVVFTAIIVLSLWLFAFSVPELSECDKGKAIAIIIALSLLCTWVMPFILFEETLIGIIILSAKIVTSGTAIYCIVNKKNDFEAVFFDPFNSDNKKGE